MNAKIVILMILLLFAVNCSENSVTPTPTPTPTQNTSVIDPNDIDGDGIANDVDDDIDNDGIANDKDDDIDNDGISNDEDDDIDNDGVLNEDETNENDTLNEITNNDSLSQDEKLDSLDEINELDTINEGNDADSTELDTLNLVNETDSTDADPVIEEKEDSTNIVEPKFILGLNGFSSPLIEDDYCYVSTYNDQGIAMLIKYNLANDKATVPLMTNTQENAYISFDVNKGNISYLMYDNRYNYNITYRKSGTIIDKAITNDNNYREDVTVGDKYIACVDYRDMIAENNQVKGTGNGNTLPTESVNSEIYYYDIETLKETRLTDDDYFQYKPLIREGYLVFVEYDFSNNSKIKLYDLSSKMYIDVPQFADISENPKLNGGILVWEEGTGEYFDIVSYNIKTGVRKIVNDQTSTYRGNPDIFNGNIVWEHYNLATTSMDISKIESNSEVSSVFFNSDSYDGAPAIGENYIVWLTQNGDNYFELYKAALK